jgi:transcriptional regulator with XRE-family HTH domain
MPATKYSELRAKMSPQARARAQAKTLEMLREMALHELRQARQLTQERLADILQVDQAAVSKMERRTDTYISTLRSYVQAMGGDLMIIAHFPDGDVRLKQFEDLDESKTVVERERVRG